MSHIIENFEEGLATFSGLTSGCSMSGFNENDSFLKDMDSFALPESPNYTNVSNLDLGGYLSNLKKRYPKLSRFSHVTSYYTGDELIPFLKYLKENPKSVSDVILGPEIFYEEKFREYPNYRSFSIIEDDFAFILKRDYIRQDAVAFLFFNNYQLIKDKFFKTDITKYDPNIYELVIENNQYALNKIDVRYVEKPIFEKEILENIESDIRCFFDNKQFYVDNNLPRKRGLIVHGPHGNGKTSLVKDILTRYKDTYRILIDCRIFDQSVSEYINKVFPENGDKIVVFEDVESISEGGDRAYSKRSSFLNFIDGPKTMENTLFLATTNHPDLVDPALIDRPSRFDRIYKVDLPNEECRKQFLLKYFPELKKESKDVLDKYIQDTKDFSGAYFKELFIVTGIQKCSLPEAISNLRKQIKVRRNKKFDNSKGVGLQVD